MTHEQYQSLYENREVRVSFVGALAAITALPDENKASHLWQTIAALGVVLLLCQLGLLGGVWFFVVAALVLGGYVYYFVTTVRKEVLALASENREAFDQLKKRGHLKR